MSDIPSDVQKSIIWDIMNTTSPPSHESSQTCPRTINDVAVFYDTNETKYRNSHHSAFVTQTYISEMKWSPRFGRTISTTWQLKHQRSPRKSLLKGSLFRTDSSIWLTWQLVRPTPIILVLSRIVSILLIYTSPRKTTSKILTTSYQAVLSTRTTVIVIRN